jgi:hypothetical protein
MLLLKFKRQDFVQICFFMKNCAQYGLDPVLDLNPVLDKDPEPETETEPEAELFVAF